MTQRHASFGLAALLLLGAGQTAWSQPVTPVPATGAAVNPTPMPPGSVAGSAPGMGGAQRPPQPPPIPVPQEASVPGGRVVVPPPVTPVDPRLVDLPDAAEAARQRQAADHERQVGATGPGPQGSQGMGTPGMGGPTQPPLPPATGR